MARVKVIQWKDAERVERGWGYELWIANSPLYCGKLLHVEEGKRCSMHYHLKKTESMFVSTGCAMIRFIDPETGKEYDEFLYPGDSILIEPGQAHSIAAEGGDLDLFEFSTEHFEDDSYRVWKGN